MEFTIEQRLGTSVDRLQALLLDPSYVVARAELPKLGEPELVETDVAGEIATQAVRLRFTGDLSSAVTAVVDPRRLTWVDRATWQLASHRAAHEIVPDHYADRLACTYEEVLVADGAGTHRTLRGAVRVRMMLVGGKVEAAIVSGLREYAAAESSLIERLTGETA